MRNVDISVVVPTFNRASSLDALLGDLVAQEVAGITYEVIAVDNASTDSTCTVARRWCDLSPAVRYVFEPRPGASHARNAGIAAANAPIIAFIDDDIRPRRDWLASIARGFASHPEVDCIGGRVEPRWPRQPPGWLTARHYGPLALQMGRGTSTYIDADHASACLGSGNFACRAQVFREVGGFSAAFMRDEDREFNLRLWRAGKRGMYDDSVVAVAEVQSERLEKRYHRQWYAVTGASHARLRYRAIIDRDGRLRDEGAGPRCWLGSPRFLYREFLQHAAGWFRAVYRAQPEETFFHECRMRYLVHYFRTSLLGVRPRVARQ
jgi:glycosyltransferase involved in cell wall biosynthesis